MRPTSAGIAETSDVRGGEGRGLAYIVKSRILAEAPVLGHLVVNPERNTAGQSHKKGEEKRNSCRPSFRLRLVLQRADNGMEAVQVEPHKYVNRGIDEEYDGAVEEVADGVAVDGDHLPEGAQGEEKTHSEVCEGQADDVQVESLIKREI